MEGWVKTHRKMADWQWAASPNHVALFWHLLIRANYKETKWRNETLSAGQLMTGRKQLSNWTGLSERQVRTVLKDLKNSGEIDQRTTRHYSIITITNWHMYQGEDQQATSRRPASDQLATTSKKYNKYNKYNNNISCASSDAWKQWVEAFQLETGRKLGFTKAAQKLIEKLISQKYTLEDCKLVCKYKNEQWAKDERMKKYLTPQTLFSGKFETYLDEAKVMLPEMEKELDAKVMAFFGLDR